MEIEGPRLFRLQAIRDDRGTITVVEASKHCGFDARRMYTLMDTAEGRARGAHAHKSLRQVLVCQRGSVRVETETANGKSDFLLDSPELGLYLPPGCWRELLDFRDGAIVSVFASEEYDEGDYIRDYDSFKNGLDEEGPTDSVPYMPVSRCHDALRFDIETQVLDVLRHGPYIGGQKVDEFEASFAEYLGAGHAVGCGNGFDALALLLQAWDVGAGDEVVVPSNSFVASALAVQMTGAKAVLADCDPETGLLGPAQIRPLLTSRTRAVMPVHLHGMVADMDAINDMARPRNVKVVEDACQAHGAGYKGRHAGTLGDAAAFSFYPTKNLGAAGDAGAMVTNDASLARKLRQLRNYGSAHKYEHVLAGRNSRLDPLQAAILSVKLPLLDGWNARRRQIASIYAEELGACKAIALPNVPSEVTPSWHVYAIRLKSAALRDKLASHLASKGVGTNIHYPVPIHRQPSFRGSTQASAELKAAEAWSDSTLSIPCDAYHTDAEIRRVTDEIRRFLKTHAGAPAAA